MKVDQLRKELKQKEDKEKAVILQRFFKTGEGEYGEGDKFLGITVPAIRTLARKYIAENSLNKNPKRLNLDNTKFLLNSEFHEERLLALLILVLIFPKAAEEEKESIFNFYVSNTDKINNWDLVDLSAPNIVGNYLFKKDRSLLFEFAASENLWKKRISILSTFFFIKQNDFSDSLKISEILLNDKHDLIHKGVGWMLREIGKRDLEIEEDFLKKHYKKMPRTMLRYSIEKFEETKRKAYLKGEI